MARRAMVSALDKPKLKKYYVDNPAGQAAEARCRGTAGSARRERQRGNDMEIFGPDLNTRGTQHPVHPGVSGSYSFETPRTSGIGGRSRHPGDSSTKSDLKVFLQRMELDSVFERHFQADLRDFVVQHHANILWYDGALRREVCLRNIYFGVNVLLLLAIPLVIAGLTFYSNNPINGFNLEGGVTASMITAGLSGLFGVQRALTAWLDKRQLTSLYSRTRAKLKTAVYTFEQTWREAGPGTTDFGTFGKALFKAIEDARNTVQEEQEAHYDISAAPTFSLQDVLSGAASGAQSLTAQLAVKETPEQAQQRQHIEDNQKTARDFEAEIQQCQLVYAQKSVALAGEQDPDKRKALTDDIGANNTKQRQAELGRAIIIAELNQKAA